MIKAKNEEVLKALVDGCTGVFGTLEQAIVELGQPRLKSTRPVTSYKGQLTLGDPEQYKSAMCIDVERYPRTMVARAPTASQFVHNSDLSNGQASTQSSATMLVDGDMLEAGQTAANPNGLTSVRNARTYQVDDDDAPGGKRDVDREELAKGYEYGRTAVHISESDENVTKLETKAALEIIGFVPMAKVGTPCPVSILRGILIEVVRPVYEHVRRLSDRSSKDERESQDGNVFLNPCSLRARRLCSSKASHERRQRPGVGPTGTRNHP